MIRIVGFYILCEGGRKGRERVGIEADSGNLQWLPRDKANNRATQVFPQEAEGQ